MSANPFDDLRQEFDDMKRRLSALESRKEPEPIGEKWLTAKEIAPIIGKTPNSVYRDARSGKIPSRMFGGSRKFLLSQVQGL